MGRTKMNVTWRMICEFEGENAKEQIDELRKLFRCATYRDVVMKAIDFLQFVSLAYKSGSVLVLRDRMTGDETVVAFPLHMYSDPDGDKK